MGFDLLLAMWITAYLTRNTVQDLAWKARGEDPPSFRREQERLANRRARRPITDRREGRRFWANAWHDAWESAGERRARGYAQRAERRRERWQHDDDVAVAERQAHDRNRELDTAEDRAHERNARIDSCEQCDQPIIGSLLQAQHRPDGKFVLACPPCAEQLDRAGAAGRPIPAAEQPGERSGGPGRSPEPTGPAGWQRPAPPLPRPTIARPTIECASCGRRVPYGDTTTITVDGARLQVCPPCRLRRAEQPAPEQPGSGRPEQLVPAPFGDAEHTGERTGGQTSPDPDPDLDQARTSGTDRGAGEEDPDRLPDDGLPEDAYELTEPTRPDQPEPGSDQSIDQDSDRHGAAATAEPSGERSEEQPGEGPDAQVIQLPVWQSAEPIQHPTQHDPNQHDPNQQEEYAMSETTSLNSALAYTTQMSGNAGQAATSVETSIASLMAGGVTGPAITALQAAQEAMNTAAAQFQAAHAALQRHIQVQEAYAANSDAGTREFVRAD
jgi:hypothetical protein